MFYECFSELQCRSSSSKVTVAGAAVTVSKFTLEFNSDGVAVVPVVYQTTGCAYRTIPEMNRGGHAIEPMMRAFIRYR